MAINSHPYYGQTVFKIEGRPLEHEALIQRQGQLSRLVQAKKCPCISQGRAQLFCPLCKGKGYSLNFQREIEVIEENSKHCGDKIYPFWNPITRVMRVARFLSAIQGGNKDFPILSYTDDEITIDTLGEDLKRYEQLKVTYAYSSANKIVNENCIHNGTYTIKTIATEIDTSGITSNPFFVHGDVISVSRVYNVTQVITYNVLSFARQSIYLDDESGTKPAPLITDILEVDYEFVSPIKVVTSRIDYENALQKWGEDIKEGDVEATLPGSYYIGRGDIITFLTSFFKGQSVIIRGDGEYDEIPQFDVAQILEDIEDEDGVVYDSSKFELREYNNLHWITASKPARGKRYSIIYTYRPSYIIYKRQVSMLNAEDKRFPHNVYLRLFDRLTIKDLEIIK